MGHWKYDYFFHLWCSYAWTKQPRAGSLCIISLSLFRRAIAHVKCWLDAFSTVCLWSVDLKEHLLFFFHSNGWRMNSIRITPPYICLWLYLFGDPSAKKGGLTERKITSGLEFSNQSSKVITSNPLSKYYFLQMTG